MDAETAKDEVELAITVNFSDLDNTTPITINIDGDEVEHELTAEEITAGSFIETYGYTCEGDKPGEKTISVSAKGADATTITDETKFTVIAEEAKKKN